MSCIGKAYIFIDVQEQVNDCDVKEGTVYVCENDKLFQLKCPCGCGDIIKGQLFPLPKPRWKVTNNSMSPSIQREVGCRSHFTITNGITH